MAQYIHLGLPNEMVELLDAKAKETFLRRADVAKQYLMKALLEDAVVELRKKQYSVSRIGEALHIPTKMVLDVIAKRGIDETLYGPNDAPEEMIDHLARKMKSEKHD